ncbi:hypothetical protein ACSHT0_15615 [Tepidicaulis sp. LMO-SS28]|uniref:hypothetical protein n=1 Tax=Tepidicaulis sp. LMO-SS28 TaxID=3447455 RepID=UPI003EE14C18
MEPNDKCPIWGTPARREIPSFDGYFVESKRCGGHYQISRSAAIVIGSKDDALKARLTTWIIDQRQLGEVAPTVLSSTIEEIENKQPLEISERATRLLEMMKLETPTVGERIQFSLRAPEQKMLAWSESTLNEEVKYLLDYLEENNFVKRLPPQQLSNDYIDYVVTPTGHNYLFEIKRKAVDSSRAFVAMWFDKSMSDAYTLGIEPAIRDAGYEAIRIDQHEHNNKIDDEIIAAIRRSAFLVADFTADFDLATNVDVNNPDRKCARGGVYYEAGFAHGLNKPVIFTCRADTISRTHFDTRQYNHIVWTTPEELRERLGQRISATIGDGPLLSAAHK